MEHYWHSWAHFFLLTILQYLIVRTVTVRITSNDPLLNVYIFSKWMTKYYIPSFICVAVPKTYRTMTQNSCSLHPSILNMAPAPFPKNIHLSALSATCMVWLRLWKRTYILLQYPILVGYLKKEEKKKERSSMFHQDVFCKDSIGYHRRNTPYFIASPRSWLCPLVYSEHSDRLTGVTLCSTWLNAAQQWSNDVHTAYSPGRISHSRTTAESFLKTLRQMKQPFPHSPFTLLQLAHPHSLLHLFVHIH